MALSRTTQDHDEIRRWAEARGGKPAEVARTGENSIGILRIEFPGATNANDSNLQEISWDRFFKKFDASHLSLVYQDVTAEGAQSNFNKFTHPENSSDSISESVRKPLTKKTAAKKTPGRQAGAAKKNTGRKTPSTKAAEHKVQVKKGAAKKITPAKQAARSIPAKKTAARSTSTKEETARKKGSARKTSEQKTAARRRR